MGYGAGGLVRFTRVLGPLQLHLEPLHADLEAVHRTDSRVRATRIVILTNMSNSFPRES